MIEPVDITVKHDLLVDNKSEEGGDKNESAIHSDMIGNPRDSAEIWVDDTLLYQNGRFVIDF